MCCILLTLIAFIDGRRAQGGWRKQKEALGSTVDTVTTSNVSGVMLAAGALDTLHVEGGMVHVVQKT